MVPLDPDQNLRDLSRLSPQRILFERELPIIRSVRGRKHVGSNETETCVYSLGVGEDLNLGNPFRHTLNASLKRALLAIRIVVGQVSLSVPKNQGGISQSNDYADGSKS